MSICERNDRCRPNTLTNSLGVVVLMVLGVGTVGAQETTGDDVELETITVTGSRIPRLDPQMVTPVQIYDAEFIAQTGAGSVQDFLFTASFAGPALFNENSTLSQTSGTANFDSRGFGDDYVVVLLNGRRLPGDPLGGDSATNLNLIPITAVERVEYLSTGASAIYGADAVQGVLNIITKQESEGLTGSLRYDSSIDGDGPRNSFGFSGGIVNDQGFVTISLDYQQQEDVDAVGLTLAGSAIAPDGVDGRSPTGLPGTYVDFGSAISTSFPVQGCPASSVRPATVAATGTECSYDFAQLYDIIPEQERFNSLTSAEYRLSDLLTAYGEFRYSRNFTEVRNGAAPAFFNITGAPFLAEVDAQNGTDLANSPAVFILRRSVDAGPRAQDSTNTAFSTVLGARFELGSETELDVSIQNVESEMNQVGVGGMISVSALVNAVATGVLDPRLTYDPQFYDDNGLTVSTQRQAVGNERVLNAQLTGMIGGSDIGYALAAQYKDDEFFDRADIASSTGDVAGGASSNGSGARDSLSFGGEISYSPIDTVELSAAARWDDYSWEGAGASSGDDALTYMAAASFRPIENLMLRASYGTGFKAPALGELFLGRSFGVTTAVDTTLCNQTTADPNATQAQIDNACRSIEIRSASGGNPLLKTESSENFSVGMVFEPTDNWSIALDYYNISVEDKIGRLTVQEIINNEAQYPNLVTRVNGTLTPVGAEVRSNLQNLSKEEGSGIDLSTRASWDVGDGTLAADVRIAYLVEHNRQLSAVQPLCDDAGATSEPEWRVNGQLGWRVERWSATMTVRYLGETEDLPGGRDTLNNSCAPNPSTGAVPVDDYLEFGLRGTYALSERVELVAGLINLTDEEPPFSRVVANTWPWYDQALYDPRGTRFYLNLNFALD